MKRNDFLEADGLYWESETHEWFHDKISTNYAQTNNGLYEDLLSNIFCFITRNKIDGDYIRVIVDSNTNQIIFDSRSVEEIGCHIDKLKLIKRFKSNSK